MADLFSHIKTTTPRPTRFAMEADARPETFPELPGAGNPEEAARDRPTDRKTCANSNSTHRHLIRVAAIPCLIALCGLSGYEASQVGGICRHVVRTDPLFGCMTSEMGFATQKQLAARVLTRVNTRPYARHARGARP